MKKFEKVFTDNTDKVKDIVYRKYKIQPYTVYEEIL